MKSKDEPQFHYFSSLFPTFALKAILILRLTFYNIYIFTVLVAIFVQETARHATARSQVTGY